MRSADRGLSVGSRVFLIVGGSAAALMLLTVGVATASIYQAGSIAVDVAADEGSRITLSVPAGLANLVIALIPGPALREATHDVPEIDTLVPAARSAADALLRSPDFTAVEVRDGGDHVLVRKEGRRMVVTVESRHEHIRVSVPLDTVRRALRKLEG